MNLQKHFSFGGAHCVKYRYATVDCGNDIGGTFIRDPESGGWGIYNQTADLREADDLG